MNEDIGTKIYLEFVLGDSSNTDEGLENKIIDTYVPPTQLYQILAFLHNRFRIFEVIKHYRGSRNPLCSPARPHSPCLSQREKLP